MNPIELVKKHPVISVVAVVVVVGIALLFSGGGDATYVDSGSASTGDELSGAYAMQSLNAQLSAKALEVNAAKEVALNENATKLTLAQLAKDVALQTGLWEYNLQESKIAADERSTSLVNTLTANIKQRELENEKAATEAQYASIAAQQATLLEMQKSTNATTLAIVKQQSKPKGLFSFLFG